MPKKRGKTKSVVVKPKKLLVTEKEYQRQRRLLLALEQVSKVLTVEVDLHKILEDMATIVAKALGAKWVNFWELTPDKKAAYITAMYGMKQEYVRQSRQHPISLGTALIGRAITTGKAWASSDLLTDQKTMGELGPTWKSAIKKQDYRAILCVPTISRKGPVGGMCVYYPDVHEFTNFEMRLVTIAANQAATSITNAQIFNELIAERNKTLATIQSLQDGLIMYDLEGRVVFFNPRAEEFLWLMAKDVIGKRLNEKMKGKSVYWKNLWNISQLVQKEYTTKEYSTEGPHRLVLEVSYIPVSSQYQKIGAMQVLRNITKEKEVEQLKSSFVTTASHQLRTPLSGIKWSLDMLTKESLGSLNQEQKDLLRKTALANDRLINLVADLLDVSRIEEGKFGYNFTLGDMGKLVKTLFNELKTDAERLNLDFKLKTPAKPLPQISFDANKLNIAVRNVIDNAIKYTKSGGFVKMQFQPKPADNLLSVFY